VVEALDGEQELKGPRYVAEFRQLQLEGAHESLRELLAAHATAECPIAELVVLGRPHREILRIASEQRADLIVMGVRGRGPVDLTLFGSTTNQVVRRASCPVITVRGH
jgi:nucleotide-binding universal stress UspA family protein